MDENDIDFSSDDIDRLAFMVARYPWTGRQGNTDCKVTLGILRRVKLARAAHFLFSRRQLAKDCGLSRSGCDPSVRRAIKNGWIRCVKPGSYKEGSLWFLNKRMLEQFIGRTSQNSPMPEMREQSNVNPANLQFSNIPDFNLGHAAFRDRCLGASGMRIIIAIRAGVRINPTELAKDTHLDVTVVRRRLNLMAKYRVLRRVEGNWILDLSMLDRAAKRAGTAGCSWHQVASYKRERVEYRRWYRKHLKGKGKGRRRRRKWN